MHIVDNRGLGERTYSGWSWSGPLRSYPDNTLLSGWTTGTAGLSCYGSDGAKWGYVPPSQSYLGGGSNDRWGYTNTGEAEYLGQVETPATFADTLAKAFGNVIQSVPQYLLERQRIRAGAPSPTAGGVQITTGAARPDNTVRNVIIASGAALGLFLVVKAMRRR